VTGNAEVMTADADFTGVKLRSYSRFQLGSIQRVSIVTRKTHDSPTNNYTKDVD